MFPLKSPAVLERSWVEGAQHRPGPWQGSALKSVAWVGHASSLLHLFVIVGPGHAVPSLQGSVVLTMHVHRRCAGERAQLNTGPEVGSVVPAGSPAPPSWISASLTPLYTPGPTQGSLVPLGTLTAGPRGGSHSGFSGPDLPFWALLWRRAECACVRGGASALLVLALCRSPWGHTAGWRGPDTLQLLARRLDLPHVREPLAPTMGQLPDAQLWGPELLRAGCWGGGSPLRFLLASL